jgi:hypothetical protein
LKKNLTIAIVVLGLGVVAYFGYFYWIQSKFSAWKYIPTSALVILESNTFQYQEKDSAGRMSYQSLPLTQQAQASLQVLREVIQDSSLYEKFFFQKNLLFSLHTETKNRLHFITYLPFNPATDAKQIEAVVNPAEATGLRPFIHTFDGIKITELYKGTAKEPILAYVLHDNYLIYSPSGLLMEDVVRRIKQLGAGNSQVQGTLIDEATKPKERFTRLYLNEENLLSLGQQLFGQDDNLSKLALPLLSKQLSYQMGINKAKGWLEASSTIRSEDASPLVAMVEQQKPSTLRNLQWIPNNTAVLMRISVSNATLLGQNATNYLSKFENRWLEKRRTANDDYLLSLDSVYYYVRDEVLFCTLETDGSDATGHLLVLPSRDANKLFNLLSFESEKIKLVTKKPHIRENYLNYPLRELDLPLPSLLFGNVCRGFEKCFFSVYGSSVIIADDPQVLKNALTDLSINNVWANNPRQKAQLSGLDPAQLSYIVNPTKSWSRLLQGISERWIPSVEQIEMAILSLGQVVVQINNTGGNTQVVARFSKGQPATADAFLNKSFLQKQIPIGKTLLKAPFLYKNSSTRLYEVMLQTTDNQLTFVQGDGKVLAKYDLKKPIVSDVLPIDYFKNGRRQYIFALDDQLMVFDRTDSLVAFYPSEPFKADLSHFSIFYDEATRRQKLIISDLRGLYYTYNKTDKTLKPLNFIKDISHTVVPVQSVTLGGIDYDILLQESGKLHISNALGAEIKNSPFDLQAKFNSPVFIESSAQYSSYVFHAVSRQGEVITVNLRGEVLDRMQLIRPAKDSDFQLLPEQSNNDWLITCTTGQTMSVLNKRGDLLFQFQNLPPDAFELRYYNFGSDIKFLALRTGKQTKIYDLSGQQIGNKAIDADFPVSLAYSETYNKLFIYAANKNNLDIWSVKLR